MAIPNDSENNQKAGADGVNEDDKGVAGAGKSQDDSTSKIEALAKENAELKRRLDSNDLRDKEISQKKENEVKGKQVAEENQKAESEMLGEITTALEDADEDPVKAAEKIMKVIKRNSESVRSALSAEKQADIQKLLVDLEIKAAHKKVGEDLLTETPELAEWMKNITADAGEIYFKEKAKGNELGIEELMKRASEKYKQLIDAKKGKAGKDDKGDAFKNGKSDLTGKRKANNDKPVQKGDESTLGDWYEKEADKRQKQRI